MQAFLFPGQGAQFVGMGKELYEENDLAKELFEKANVLLGFEITEIMFRGTEEELKQTRVTQPAVFLHSVIWARLLGKKFNPQMVAGHSLGEFSALVATGGLSFEAGLSLVAKRANAMQEACEKQSSGMAAVLGMEDNLVEQFCAQSSELVVPANYNAPGQLVISGTLAGIDDVTTRLQAAGAKKIIKLNVSGAFHSPLMEHARVALEHAIEQVEILSPCCPIYQNVDAQPTNDPKEIKRKLIMQLTSSVRWTQTIQQMVNDGATLFTEIGPGNVLQVLTKKINRTVATQSATAL